MITTCDGAIETEGTSRGLGGPADQARLIALRRAADMVLVGAGTVRDEGYGPPSKSGLRIAVVTGTCELDFSMPLFASGAGLVVTTTDAPDVPVESVRAGTGRIDWGGVLDRIGAMGVGLIQLEGGPRLNRDLVEADLVDAINLTFSPRLTGARGRSIAEGRFDARRFALASVETVDEFVFVRYERLRSA